MGDMAEDDQNISVKITADGSGVGPGVNQAASSIESASASMGDALKNAMRAIQQASDQINKSLASTGNAAEAASNKAAKAFDKQVADAERAASKLKTVNAAAAQAVNQSISSGWDAAEFAAEQEARKAANKERAQRAASTRARNKAAQDAAADAAAMESMDSEAPQFMFHSASAASRQAAEQAALKAEQEEREYKAAIAAMEGEGPLPLSSTRTSFAQPAVAAPSAPQPQAQAAPAQAAAAVEDVTPKVQRTAAEIKDTIDAQNVGMNKTTQAVKDAAEAEGKSVDDILKKVDALAGGMDPLTKATDEYLKRLKLLEEAKPHIDPGMYNDLLKQVNAEMDEAEKAAASAATQGTSKLAAELEKLESKFDPVTKATAAYSAQMKTLNDALAAGLITPERYAEASKHVVSAFENTVNAGQKAEKTVNSFGMTSAETTVKLRALGDELASGRIRQFDGTLTSIIGKIAQVNPGLAIMGGSLAALAASAFAIDTLEKKFAEYGEQVSRAAQATGVSTDNIQKWDFAAKEAGASPKQMEDALMHLAGQMTNAERGAKQAQATFAALGISMAELKTMTPEQVFMRMADAYRETANTSDNAELATNRLTVAHRALGGAAESLIPLLNKGSDAIRAQGDEAERLGILTAEQVAQAVEMKEQMAEASAHIEALSINVGAQLAPAFLALTTAMASSSQQGGILYEAFELLKGLLAGMVTIIGAVVVTLYSMGSVFVGNVEAINDAVHGRFQQAIDDMKEGWKRASEAAEAYGNVVAKVMGFDDGGNKVDTGHGDDNWGDKNSKPTGATFKMPDIGTKKGSKGQFSVINAEAQVELAQLKDSLKEASSIYDEEYKHGRVSLQQYYAARLQIQQAGLQGELKIKQQELSQLDAQIAKTPPDQQNQLLAKRIALVGQLGIMQGQLDRSAADNARQLADAQKQLDNEITNSRMAAEEQVSSQIMSRERALAEEKVKLGTMTQQQLIALEASQEQQAYEMQRTRLQTQLDQLGQYELQKRQQINGQIEVLEAQHQTKMTELQIQSTDDQLKYQEQAQQSIQNDFNSLFENLMSGQKKVTQVFLDFFNQVYANITKMVSNDITQKLFQDQGGGNLLSQGLSFITGKGAGGAGAAAAGAAGTQQMTVASAANVSLDAIANSTCQEIATMTVMSAGTVNVLGGASGGGGGGGIGGLGDLLGGLGMGGDFAGAFGFSDAAVSGSSAAVGSGILDATATTGGSYSALMGLAAFADGTNYVPDDMIAMIHKGESIVPARYNANAVGTATSSNVTNNFALSGPMDRRTMQQIAVQAGGSIQMAMRRNS